MTILVRSGLAGGRVALWERHPDHPDGEVFVAGDVAVEAAETPAVLSRLESGRLLRVDAPEEPNDSEIRCLYFARRERQSFDRSWRAALA